MIRYIAIMTGYDPYAGLDVEEFESKDKLIEYIKFDKVYLRKNLIAIYKITKNVTGYFTAYLDLDL